MVLDSDIEKEQPRLAATKEFTTKIANQERTVLESELKTDPTWIKAYKTIHKTQYGTEAEGTDEELSANALNFMADTVYPIATVNGDGLALVYNRFKDAPAEEQAALYYMIDTMEKKDITGRGVKAAFKALGKDPTTYLGLTGVGFFGKAAARETAKKGLIQMLKMGIKSNMGQAAMAGGAYLGGEEAVLQDLKVGAGIQEDINWEDVGVMTGMGAGFGATITAAMPYIMKATGMTVKEIGRFIKERGGEILDTPLGDVITGLQRIVPNEAPMPKEAPQFYSQLETALAQTSQKTWNKEQLKGFLAKQGVKAEEMKWSGLDDYLEGKTKVSTDELLSNMNQPKLEKTTNYANAPTKSVEQYMAEIKQAERKKDWNTAERLTQEMEDMELGSGESKVKYGKYTTKDIGTNYREELTTVTDNARLQREDISKQIQELNNADIEKLKTMGINSISDAQQRISELKQQSKDLLSKETQYKSSHWDENNVLYHVRKQDVEIDGDNTMLIEEIQSDWHQEGRKKGYKEKPSKKDIEISEWYTKRSKENDFNYQKTIDETAEKFGLSEEATRQANTRAFGVTGVPQAPYSKTWHEKAMKDQIAEAVETGKDRVAWIAGKEQADRYSLSKQIDTLEYHKTKSGKYEIDAYKDNTNVINKKGLSEQELADFIGKDVADKIIKGEKTDVADSGKNVLSGIDLEVGGEGMKGFYDQILPKWTDKYIKKYDSKVEVKKLANGQEVWSFKVTDKMKKELKGKGQALYSGAAGVGIAASQQEDNK
jgi:ribosomal protein L12E/L44/L45/RPP1/RPP2